MDYVLKTLKYIIIKALVTFFDHRIPCSNHGFKLDALFTFLSSTDSLSYELVKAHSQGSPLSTQSEEQQQKYKKVRESKFRVIL